MDLKPLLDQFGPQIEIFVKAQVSAHSDEIVELAIVKIEEAIKGDIDNMILDVAKPKIKEAVKAALLGFADKISDKV